ncbi:MAG: phosphoribosylformylglycinamidine synthase subunit PurS, partial [Bradyrhizobium sp.]
MKATVHVFLKPGVLDVQGKAVEQALHGLGWP